MRIYVAMTTEHFPTDWGTNGEQGHFIKSNVLKDAPETAPVPQAPSWRAGPVRVRVLSKGDIYIYIRPPTRPDLPRIRPVLQQGSRRNSFFFLHPRAGEARRNSY